MKRRKHTEAPGCRACKWTGRIPQDMQQRDPLTGLMVTVFAQAYCDCALGTLRRQQARERDAATALR